MKRESILEAKLFDFALSFSIGIILAMILTGCLEGGSYPPEVEGRWHSQVDKAGCVAKLSLADGVYGYEIVCPGVDDYFEGGEYSVTGDSIHVSTDGQEWDMKYRLGNYKEPEMKVYWYCKDISQGITFYREGR